MGRVVVRWAVRGAAMMRAFWVGGVGIFILFLGVFLPVFFLFFLNCWTDIYASGVWIGAAGSGYRYSYSSIFYSRRSEYNRV